MPVKQKEYLAERIVRRVSPSLREKRIGPLLELISESYARKGSVNLIDIGGTKAFWALIASDLLEECEVKVRIINLPGVEKARVEDRFVYADGNGCDLREYSENEFDVAFSNSVIEHVGEWAHMRMFANEVRRISGSYFVQTPNFWFPVEPHCMTPAFHWLPFATRVWLLRRFDLGHWRGRRDVDSAVRTAQSAKLLNASMMCELFPDAELLKERFFLLPKSLMLVKR